MNVFLPSTFLPQGSGQRRLALANMFPSSRFLFALPQTWIPVPMPSVASTSYVSLWSSTLLPSADPIEKSQHLLTLHLGGPAVRVLLFPLPSRMFPGPPVLFPVFLCSRPAHCLDLLSPSSLPSRLSRFKESTPSDRLAPFPLRPLSPPARPLSPFFPSPLRSTSPPPPPPSQPQHLVNLGNQLGGRHRGVPRGSPSPGSPEDACGECCRAVACSREGLRAARPPRAGRAAVPRPAAEQAQLRPAAHQTPHLL